MGGYVSCDHRAALDRLVAEGKIAPSTDAGSSPYADLGVCIHYNLQVRLGAVFPEGHQTPVEELVKATANASQIFKGDIEATRAQVERCSLFAAQCMPPTMDNKPWLAEASFSEGLDVPGHIDFLSQDGAIIVDLKTTSHKPEKNRIKAGHLIQLLMYYVASGRKARYGYILYIDSTKAEWAILSKVVDFNSPELQVYVTQLTHYAAYLRSPELLHMALARPGTHCVGEFCPHQARCRERLIPQPSEVLYNDAAPGGMPKTEGFKL
jgi:hypothetical protein